MRPRALLVLAGLLLVFSTLSTPCAQGACRPDQVLNDDGECVCPPDQTDDGGTNTCHPICPTTAKQLSAWSLRRPTGQFQSEPNYPVVWRQDPEQVGVGLTLNITLQPITLWWEEGCAHRTQNIAREFNALNVTLSLADASIAWQTGWGGPRMLYPKRFYVTTLEIWSPREPAPKIQVFSPAAESDAPWELAATYKGISLLPDTLTNPAPATYNREYHADWPNEEDTTGWNGQLKINTDASTKVTTLQLAIHHLPIGEPGYYVLGGGFTLKNTGYALADAPTLGVPAPGLYAWLQAAGSQPYFPVAMIEAQLNP